MGQALYRKYRSRSFDEVVGQDHIIQTLKNAVKSGKVSHAYLFTGPRGVGKTSVARILAHAVNGLDYQDESAHLDIIEIDAASNRRIDEIRELRDRVRVAPTSSKYKVYIIDEVHMLTREAFNALLKTLEEPPAHVIFILATTEAHKLPETIISRTQRFEFKPVGNTTASKHLRDLAVKEKINISDEALNLLAEFGNGSFRDSISYLDQLSSLGREINEDDVRSTLGLPTGKSINELLDMLESGDSAKLLHKLIEIEEQGVNAVSAAAGLSNRLRNAALEGKAGRRQIELLRQLSQVSSSSRPQEALEITLLAAISYSAPEPAPPKSETKPPATKPLKRNLPAAKPTVSKPKTKPASKGGSFDLSQWDTVLERAKSEAASIYTALRLAQPEFSEGSLTLGFQFPLHQKKLAEVKNQEMVSRIIKEVSGDDVPVQSVLRERPAAVIALDPVEEESVSAINNIFGGAEIMEA